MSRLVKFEIRKNLLKRGLIIIWILALLLANMLVHQASLEEVYADGFYKAYGYSPIIGLLIFMALSSSYTREYESKSQDLINSTVNGREKIVLAKAIGASLSALIISLSLVGSIYLDALKINNFKGLTTPLRELWYFKGIDSNLRVLDMILLMILTIIAASIFFAQLALYLSSRGSSPSLVFIVGGLIMGLPYILAAYLPKSLLALSPLWTMMSSELVKINLGLGRIIIQAIILIFLSLILVRLTSKEFIKERN